MLPIFYFRPTLVIIDDNKQFTDSLAESLRDRFKVIVFNKEHELLEWIERYKSTLLNTSFINDFSESEYSYDVLTSLVELNLNKIVELAHNKEKYDEIGVLIADYVMPEINGIDLCKKLAHSKFKKLLLTGIADYKMGVAAMNEHAIDFFINKEIARDELIAKIEHYAFEYYTEITTSLATHLEAKQKLPLSDQHFINYFTNFIKVNQIKEYYLIDKNGSLLLINELGKKSVFIVHTDTSLEGITTIIEDDPEMSAFIDTLKTRASIPWFGIGTSIDYNNLSTWQNHLYTPETICGNSKYYVHHHKID